MHLPKNNEGRIISADTAVSHQRAAKVCWIHAVYGLVELLAQSASVLLPILYFSPSVLDDSYFRDGGLKY